MTGKSNPNLKSAFEYIRGVGLSFVAPTDEMVDWHHAASIAFTVAEVDRWKIDEPWSLISEEFSGLVKRVEPVITDFTGLEPTRPIGYPVIFDRAEWIVTALDTIKQVVEPILERLINAFYQDSGDKSFSKRITKATATSQIGTVMGYMSRRVLGQFDLPLSGEIAEIGKVYFIFPNIKMIEERFGLDKKEFRLWLALHETTHSFEFDCNPWLQRHLLDLIDEHTDYMETKLKKTLFTGDDERISAANIIFSKSFWELFNAGDNKTLGRIQAFMALIEGYSEFVMKRISRDLIVHSQSITTLFERRRRSQSWAQRLLDRFIGLDLKLSQYEMGEKFVSDLYRYGGMELVNKCWDSPETLPDLNEIVRPDIWIKRNT